MLFSLIVPFDETGEFLPGAYGPILFREMGIVETGSSPTVREGLSLQLQALPNGRATAPDRPLDLPKIIHARPRL